MKVALCLPSYADTKARFTYSLAEMVIWSLGQKVTYNGQPTCPQLRTFLVPGCGLIDRARNALAEDALEWNADYLLWLDADHTFPPNAMFALMAHDLPFVGCNYRKRARIEECVSAAGVIVDGTLRPIEPKPSGLEPVDVIGFGLCLTKAPLFRKIAPPWFGLGPAGEDGYFCEQARKAGIRPHVDHALSMETGHIAETVLRFPS